MAAQSSQEPLDALLPRVEKLVQRLYLPANPEEIEQIQLELQEVQRSFGWIVADGLLSSQDKNVRFFAALTFTVKLNQDGASLEEDDMIVVLEKLLSWLVRLVARDESLLVLRKLCSTLVTYFVLPKSKWTRCIRHVICALHTQEPISEDALDRLPPTDQLVPRLTEKQLSIAVTFANSLAEDAGRIDRRSQQFHYCHKRIETNIEDVVELMRRAIALLTDENSDFENNALQCYQSWLGYMREEFSSSSEQLQPFHTIFGLAIDCLFYQSSFENAAEFFIDLFTSSEPFLNNDEVLKFARLFDSAWMVEHLASLDEADPNEDSVLVAQIVLAFGQSISETLVETGNTLRIILDIILRLTASQNHKNLDHALSNAVVDFWETYTSNVTDPGSTEGLGTSIFTVAKAYWLAAVDKLCNAASLPMNETGEFKRLAADHPIMEFRSRVQSAIQASYTEFGVALLDKLVSMVLATAQQSASETLQHSETTNYTLNNDPPISSGFDFGRLETVFYCLSGISDSMEYGSGDLAEEDKLLKQLFGSQIYSYLTNFSMSVPTKLRKRAISIIGDQENFFKRNFDYLLPALEMLFRALEHQQLQDIAALAIQNLSDSNRKGLSPKIDQFLNASAQFFSSGMADISSKERIAGAVAAVIQGLQLKEEQDDAISRLLDTVERVHDPHLVGAASEANWQSAHREQALEALGLLKAVGRALQVPDDQPIDLDDEDDDQPWNVRPAVVQVQSRIARYIGATVQPLYQDGSILEAAFDVLRTGYRETKPGAFVFDPQVTVDLVTNTPITNPRFDVAINTSAAFLSSRSAKNEASSNSVLMLIAFVCEMIENGMAASDPDISYACIEFMNRLVPVHLAKLKEIHPQRISTAFSFSIRCLEEAEFLPKKSAAHLWTSLLGVLNQPSNFKEIIDSLVLTLGPALTNALVKNFGGLSARSELDWLAEPYKKLIFKQPLTKSWTEAALFSDSFPSNRVSAADKRKFLAQLAYLRGDRKTNAVIKEFWLVCRGTPVGYG